MIYRLQSALFSLRRYVPGPLRQVLKPIYRRWWRRISQKKLAATLTGAHAPITAGASYAVVCFPAIDWEARIQRPQHLLMHLARDGHRVYYLRTDFQPGNMAAPLEPLAANVWGLRLPGPAHLSLYESSPQPSHVTAWLEALDTLSESEHLQEVVCLVHLPFWGPLALAARERWGWKVVYDCLDEHAGFPTNAPAMLAHEPALIAGSELVLTTAKVLHDKCAPLARRCTWLPNAADVEHFQRLSNPSARVPPNLSRPIIGYYGALGDWFEPEWVRAAAAAHPEWQFVLIGLNSGIDLRALEHLPNVHLLGELPYQVLPDYLHHFDAALIPFRQNALTRSTNPVKFYEYLSAGKPVAATDLPELEPYRDLFYPAATVEEFVRQVEAAVAERDPERVAARQAFARANTWAMRAAALDQSIRELYGRAAVIIVSYHNLDYLRLCLESVWAKTDYPNYEVIVVDNGSPPEVVDYLRQRQAARPDFTTIFNADNAGFARANNIGVAAAKGCDYVVLLNNDTVVTHGWLTGLVRGLHADPTIGLIGPVTNWSSTEARIAPGYTDLAGLEPFARRYTRAHAGRRRVVQTLDMFCVALRRDVLETAGPLDEGYGLGMFEDYDYALRLRRAGYRLMLTEEVYVHHWGWASFGRLDQAAYDQLFETNRRYFEAKWGQPWQRPPLALRLLEPPAHERG
jgi:GT2 family glycosyltransferase